MNAQPLVILPLPASSGTSSPEKRTLPGMRQPLPCPDLVLQWTWALFGWRGVFLLAHSYWGGPCPSVKRTVFMLKQWLYSSFLRWLQLVLRNAIRCQNKV